jgi:hypothetical protein
MLKIPPFTRLLSFEIFQNPKNLHFLGGRSCLYFCVTYVLPACPTIFLILTFLMNCTALRPVMAPLLAAILS